jgi:hypothetical protein
MDPMRLKHERQHVADQIKAAMIVEENLASKSSGGANQNVSVLLSTFGDRAAGGDPHFRSNG